MNVPHTSYRLPGFIDARASSRPSCLPEDSSQRIPVMRTLTALNRPARAAGSLCGAACAKHVSEVLKGLVFLLAVITRLARTCSSRRFLHARGVAPANLMKAVPKRQAGSLRRHVAVD